jgi:DNA-binding NarL/FixJ family response regulator
MRVLLATDRPSLGAALALFLGEHDMEVVGVVAHIQDLREVVAATHAHVVVVDLHLGPGLADAVAELRRDARRTPVVLLGPGEEGAAAGLIDADALAGFGEPPDALLALITQVGAGV